MKRLRFGIVGVGNIAPLHALAIQTLPEAELAAVATRDATRAALRASRALGEDVLPQQVAPAGADTRYRWLALLAVVAAGLSGFLLRERARRA